MTRTPENLPDIDQAEAYFGDTCVAIDSAKTARVIERMRPALGERLVAVPDFKTFLAALADRVRGAVAVVALGDSTTANYVGWPRRLGLVPALRDRDIVVINLADWGLTAADQPERLAFVLDWLKQSGAGSCSTIFLGGLLDCQYRRRAYDRAVAGLTASAILPSEAALAARDAGGELQPLVAMEPSGSDRLASWFARRTVAATRLLQQLCDARPSRFVAALQPLCFAGTAPAYAAALTDLYNAETGGGAGFVEWCRGRGYYWDLADRYGDAAREDLDALAANWRGEAASPGGAWVNLAALFRDAPENCFLPTFDAVHFSPEGATRIAAALSGFVR